MPYPGATLRARTAGAGSIPGKKQLRVIVCVRRVLWCVGCSRCVDMLQSCVCSAGKAVVHTYTAGNEPYSVWEGLQRGSKEYEDLKQQRAETLWKVRETLPAVCVLRAGRSTTDCTRQSPTTTPASVPGNCSGSCTWHDPVFGALIAQGDA